jgi:hypothetical protein
MSINVKYDKKNYDYGWYILVSTASSKDEEQFLHTNFTENPNKMTFILNSVIYYVQSHDKSFQVSSDSSAF